MEDTIEELLTIPDTFLVLQVGSKCAQNLYNYQLPKSVINTFRELLKCHDCHYEFETYHFRDNLIYLTNSSMETKCYSRHIKRRVYIEDCIHSHNLGYHLKAVKYIKHSKVEFSPSILYDYIEQMYVHIFELEDGSQVRVELIPKYTIKKHPRELDEKKTALQFQSLLDDNDYSSISINYLIKSVKATEIIDKLTTSMMSTP